MQAFKVAFTAQLAALSLCVGVWAPSEAQANEALSLDGYPTSVATNVGIVIPAILRILENSHPSSLPIAVPVKADVKAPHVSALQRLVLMSTLGKGFCMDLRMTQQNVIGWKLQISGSAGVRIESAEDGYRLCTGRAGRYDVALQHDFNLKDMPRSNTAAQLDWPIHVSLAAP